MKSLSFYIPEAWKSTPFGRSLPVQAIIGSTSPGLRIERSWLLGRCHVVLKKRNFLSQCLSPPRCIIAGDYNLVQGRGAVPNLSSSRCEALEIVTPHHSTYSKHTGNPRDYRFSLWKSELGASNSVATSAISSSLWRKIHSSPVLSFDICSTLI